MHMQEIVLSDRVESRFSPTAIADLHTSSYQANKKLAKRSVFRFSDRNRKRILFQGKMLVCMLLWAIY